MRVLVTGSNGLIGLRGLVAEMIGARVEHGAGRAA
jgi:hypothetical protein